MGRAIPGIVTVEGVVKGLKANRISALFPPSAEALLIKVYLGSSVAEKKKNPPKAVVANKEDTSSISTTPLPNAKKMMQTPVVPLLNAKKVMQNPVVAKEPNNVKLLEGRVMTRASWKRAIAHVHEEEERPVKLLKRNTTQ